MMHISCKSRMGWLHGSARRSLTTAALATALGLGAMASPTTSWASATGRADTAASSHAGAAAAPLTAGQYCGIFGSGLSDVTVWAKADDSCHDLNLVYDSLSTTYAGYYWNGSKWIEGSAGYRHLIAGSHDPDINPKAVLLTDVLPGTDMYIGAGNGAEVNVHVDINY